MIALKPLELLYRAATAIRRGFYRHGVLKAERLPRPVVSIGNLAFGGSGKTPAVITIGRKLMAEGFRIAVLTRGYGRPDPSQIAMVDSKDVDRFGDEPVLISSEIAADVIVGADRARAGRVYLRDHDCDLFLLDDGFQHLRLHRDVDIVIDSARARLLRESRSALSDADFILLRGAEPGDARSFRIELRPGGLRRRGELLPISILRGMRLFAFAGLADNEQFFELLKREGADVVGARSFRDHYRYSEADLDAIEAEAQSLKAEIVTTAKDGVKLRGREYGIVEVELHIESEARFIKALLDTIRSKATAIR